MRLTDPENLKNTNYKPAPFIVGKSTCTICGKPIAQLSANKREAAYEMKWKVHYACQNTIINYLDRHTDPGGGRGKQR